MKKTLIIIAIIASILTYAITSETRTNKQAFINKLGYYITNEEAEEQLKKEHEAFWAEYQLGFITGFYTAIIENLNK